MFNMKKYFFSSLLVLVTLALCSCSTNGLKVTYATDADIVSQSRSLSGFDKVEINGSPTVYYAQTDSFSVRVRGPKDVVDNIITEVDGSTLFVRNKGKIGVFNVTMGGDNGLAVYISSPDLIGVTLNGSGDFISERRVDTDVMNIRLKGSGDIRFSDILCDRCDAELIGSGDLDVKHLDTRETSATLVGSGDIEIRQMNAAQTQLSLRGSGDIDVDFVSGCGSVNAELQGSGDITLKGQVKHLDMHKRGSGDINASSLRVN